MTKDEELKPCPECGEKLQKIDDPVDRCFRIPFTRIDIIIRRWVLIDWCQWCYHEKQETRDRKIFEAGLESAYERAERGGI